MLISLRQLLDDAAEHGYGVPAFNINNMEQGLAILKAADRVDAPVIIQASRGRVIMLAMSCCRRWSRPWPKCIRIFRSVCIKIMAITKPPA